MEEKARDAGWAAVVIHPGDDVAVALRDLSGTVRVRDRDGITSVPLPVPVPLGHKFALRAIEPGEVVRKYGEPIGIAAGRIAAGEHVHVHNLRSARAVAGA